MMRKKFMLPEDKKERIDIWKKLLEHVKLVQKEVLDQKIAANNDSIQLGLLELKNKDDPSIESRKRELHQKEFQIRMSELALQEQRKSLENAIEEEKEIRSYCEVYYSM